MKTNLTAERLRELLSYDPATGIFTRRQRTSVRIRVGEIAGWIDDKGYRSIRVGNGVVYKAHRLAWLYMTGSWPIDQLDHINMVRDDNRWCNLREATASQNAVNVDVCVGTSGLKGVSWDGQKNKWRAMIRVRGKRKHLGHSDCRAALHFAYIVAASKAFGDFARMA